MESISSGLMWIAVTCVILGLISSLVAAFLRESAAKGRARLLGAVTVGISWTLYFLVGGTREHLLGAQFIGVFGGVFLIWLGIRKQRRDPLGKTRAAQIL